MINNISFSKFFYSSFLTLGVHLGGKENKIRKEFNQYAICKYNKFFCLDIKQSYKN